MIDKKKRAVKDNPLLMQKKESVALRRSHLAVLLHLFSEDCFLLPCIDCRRLLIILSFLPLSDDTLFLYHSLKALKGLLQWFVVVYLNKCHYDSPPLVL